MQTQSRTPFEFLITLFLLDVDADGDVVFFLFFVIFFLSRCLSNGTRRPRSNLQFLHLITSESDVEFPTWFRGRARRSFPNEKGRKPRFLPCGACILRGIMQCAAPIHSWSLVSLTSGNNIL